MDENYAALRRSNNQMMHKNNVMMNFAALSVQGCEANNLPKLNQDSFVVMNCVNNLRFQHLFAVADGHGPQGRQCSLHVKEKFPKILSKLINDQFKLQNIQTDNNLFKDQEVNILEECLN